MKMNGGQDLQQIVFHKVWTESKERDAMRDGKKTSKPTMLFETSMVLANDLVKILNANSDEVTEIINSINKKYNNKETV